MCPFFTPILFGKGLSSVANASVCGKSFSQSTFRLYFSIVGITTNAEVLSIRAEQVDNEYALWQYNIDTNSLLHASHKHSGELGGVEVLNIPATVDCCAEEEGLYQPVEIQCEKKEVDLRLIPYYSWANRGSNRMSVWLRSAL